MLYLASDHGGFEVKVKVKDYLTSKGIEFVDLGPQTYNETDDYPDYVLPLAEKVATEANAEGIILCRNGIGVTVAANKVDGVRAGKVNTPSEACSSRFDDNTNVLSLPADSLKLEEMFPIIDAWLATPFSTEERHQRRVQKIIDYEKSH